MTESPPERLSTTDRTGKRIYVYPASVRGPLKNRKEWVHGFLVLLFLALPWIRWHGKQILLLDIAEREFYFFGFHFRAHDAPLVLLLFLGFAFLIGFVTSIWGRLWCGWACPQTVFTEFLFRRIESWIEGYPRERRLLDEAPLSGRKVFLKTAKYAAFLLVSFLFTNSFLAYFVGSEKLLLMVRSSPLENWTSFLVILVTTAIVLVDFGWFREQFCIIVCPYGRLQSVMLGAKSLIVGYDAKRGEPRRGSTEGKSGDCVSCNRCVQVCPTGIDIRQGLQMECIACTACIDACNEVMQKTKKPLGLIRYMTMETQEGEKAEVNFRAFIYGALFLLVMGALAIVLHKKTFLEVETLRAKGNLYEILQSGQETLITNHFHLEISNQTEEEQSIFVQLASASSFQIILPENPIRLSQGEKRRIDFFLKGPATELENGKKKILFSVGNSNHPNPLEVTLVGPTHF